jgi:hypothetical protein
MARDHRNRKSFGTMLFGVARFGRVWSPGGPGYRDRRFGGGRSIRRVAGVLLLAVDSWGGVASMIAVAGGLRELGVSTRIASYSDDEGNQCERVSVLIERDWSEPVHRTTSSAPGTWPAGAS